MYSCNINKFKRVRDFAETYIANSYSGDRVEKGWWRKKNVSFSEDVNYRDGQWAWGRSIFF